MSRFWFCSVIGILLYHQVSFGCKPSNEAWASFESIVKSAENITYGEVVSIGTLTRQNGERVQISTWRKLKDFGGSSADFLTVTTLLSRFKKNESGISLLRCKLSKEFRIGDRYLFSPNFLFPNSFVKVNDLPEAETRIATARALAISEKVPRLYEGLSLKTNLLKIKIQEINKTCKLEKSKICSDESIKAFLLSEEFQVLISVPSNDLSQLAYEFLSLNRLYSVLEKESFDEEIIRLELAHRENLTNIAKKDTVEKAKKLKANFFRLLELIKASSDFKSLSESGIPFSVL